MQMLKKYPWIRQLLWVALAFVAANVVQMLITNRVISGYYTSVAIYMCVFVIAAVSLNLVLGITGQFSLGHAGFMALGAYFSAIMTKTGLFGLAEKLSLPEGIIFMGALLTGGVVAAAAGFLIGLPTLRLRGDYLGIATLGFGEIIRITFLNWEYVGGASGYSGVPRHTNFVWAFVLAILAVIIIRNFINSSHGRACISIREDEVAAETMGINTTKYKVTAFVIGAFFAGISGALLTHMMRLAHPNMFTFLISIEVLLMVVLGGLGSITGSIAAAVFLTFFSEWFRQFGAVRVIVYSLMMIIIMLFRPRGLLGSQEISFLMFRQLFADIRDMPKRIRKRFTKEAGRQKGVG